MFQVKEFSAFLCMGRCRSLGSLKSVLSYAPLLSWASTRCFHILSSLSSGLTVGSGCSLMAGILLPKCPLGLQSLLMTVASLFTVLAGNIHFS